MKLRQASILALLVALAWLACPMLSRRLTDDLLFYPERGQWRTPETLGLNFEEVWLDALGNRIQCWWVEGHRSGPVIVMFHGNAGTIADRLENVAALVSRFQASVLQVEYPGYGSSEGRPSEASLHAAGEAALAKGRELAAGRALLVFGRSLGGAVAIEAARRLPVDGVVAESTFTSLGDMAAASGIPLARYLVAYRFDSVAAIREVTAPILLIHGDRDEVVPYGMSERLLEAAASSPLATARLHTVSGGAHNDTWILGGEAYWRAWEAFLLSVRPATAGSRGP